MSLHKTRSLRKRTISIDGGKFKVVSAKDNNIAKNKLAKRIARIDAKIDEFNKEMGNIDQKEIVSYKQYKRSREPVIFDFTVP
jgi:uncharacterized protein (DUF1501 family)